MARAGPRPRALSGPARTARKPPCGQVRKQASGGPRTGPPKWPPRNGGYGTAAAAHGAQPGTGPPTLCAGSCRAGASSVRRRELFFISGYGRVGDRIRVLARKCARPAGIWRSLGRGRGGTASLGKRGLIPPRGQPSHGKPARPPATLKPCLLHRALRAGTPGWQPVP